MGWGLKFLRCRTVHVVSFPKMPHFSKSDKWKYSKMRGNYPVGRNEAVSGQSVVREIAHNWPISRISECCNFFSKSYFDMRSSTKFYHIGKMSAYTKFQEVGAVGNHQK